MEGCMGSSGWSQQANMKHTTPPRGPDRKCNPSGFEAGSQTPCHDAPALHLNTRSSSFSP